jgi:energy-coupling factor transport system ATP-binding protein
VVTNRPIIEITDLQYAYPGGEAAEVTALRGLTLQVMRGEFVAIVGANGSGKTTLARHFNGLLVPGAGSVVVNGLDTREIILLPQVRSQVAMVFQRPEDQIVATTIEDDVAFGPENLGLAFDEINSRVRWALEAVGLWEIRQRPPHMLSVGQQQRVAIAGALAMRPACLVLDEATAMLNPAGRCEVIALLHRLSAEGITVVLITHWMNEAAQADRLIALADGLVAFDGPPREFFSVPPRVESLGLEMPPISALGAEIRNRWPGFPEFMLTGDELAAALISFLDRGAPEPVDSYSEDLMVRKGSGSDCRELEVVDLHYTYLAGTPLETVAMEGISLCLDKGQVLGVLGPTGSGKSTLLQLVAALLNPQSGRILLRGQDVHDPQFDRRQLRDQVGMLFQRSEEQLFETYVGDDVAFGPRQLGLDRSEVREHVRWAMDVVGLPFLEFKDRFVQGLSGGERRKTALAGVLAMRPELLLLDEPTAGLDPQARRGVLHLLRNLNDDESVTLAVATHSMEDVAELVDWACVLDGGHAVGEGTPRHLFTRQDFLKAHGLAAPEVTALMQCLRSRGVPVSTDVLNVQEAVTELSRVRANS